jgi:DUF917 family protein
LNSLSLAKSLGEAVRASRKQNSDCIAAILDTCPGRVLFSGKIVELERQTTSGFARGRVVIEGAGDQSSSRMEIEFQNENLVARLGGETVCMVSDLICIVDSDKGEPITTELLRYGFRVTVLGFPAPSLWTSPEGLQVAGPRAFGYDLDYVPLEL